MATVVGRADLLRVLAAKDPAVGAALAGLLGYSLAPPEAAPPTLALPSFPAEPPPPPKDEPEPAPVETPDVPFWRPVSRTYRKGEDEATGRSGNAGADDRSAEIWRNRPAAAPPWPSLCPRNRLLPRLRAGMTERIAGRAIDLDAVVRRIANAQLPDPLPRRRQRRWGASIQVIDDRSRHLTPFWQDQDEVCQWLSRLFPVGTFSRARWLPGSEEPIRYTAHGIDTSYQPPPAGSLVLVLGDLGCLDRRGPRAIRRWLDFGRRLRAAGCVPVALTPCAPDRWPAGLRAVWRLVPWEHGAPPSVPAPTDLPPEERLLRLVAPAARVEPGLLRHIRRTVMPASGAALEAAVWQHPAIASPSSVAATLDPDMTPGLRQGFAAEGDAVQRSVLAILRQWRATLSADVWFEEILSLSADSRRHLPDTADLDAAAARFDGFSRRALAFDDSAARADAMMAVSRLLRRVPSSLHDDPRVGEAFERLKVFAHQDELDDGEALPLQSGRLDPRVIPARPGAVLRRIDLRQRGDGIVADSPDTNKVSPGSLLTSVQTVNGVMVVTTEESANPEEDRNAFWKSGIPPAWAEDWGWDDFGAWVTFRVATVVQKMRWIAPGHFRMGSPGDEAERFDNEGPQHAVTLTRGFWLFDTACSQALWRAVMDQNPSRFQDDERCPVEQVSWTEAQGFLERLNQRLPGLSLDLPTEAQWEYACRAGTTTPFSFGGTVTPSRVNYDGRHPYRNGPLGLYRERTVPVGSLPPNPWGLYEMHGNVWEWCADGQRVYTADAATDPRGPDVDDAAHVLRGGSWFNFARRVRSAVRSQPREGDRLDDIGFRCASSPASQDGGAEPAAPASPRQAERRGAQGTTGAAVLRMESGGRCPLPNAPAVRIVTDREEVRLERLTRPAWADALGRDRFGLWADLAVPPLRGGDPVVQRLRWIAPGRFLMGSPEDEAERSADEGPQHAVTLTRGFWLFDTACSQALWHAVTGENPSQFKDDERCPVEQVSWHDVQGFLERLNQRVSGLSLGLPTEAQWEYACRAGTTTPFSFGGTVTPDQVNYDGNRPYRDGPKGLFRKRTVPVGSLPPNPWGLHEMHGNVWEWCADGQRVYTADAATDPRGPETDGAERVLRGGSWISFARYVRAAIRYRLAPDDRFGSFGFRCASGPA
ncbi:formylglycine-generating enzyme family protein [Azospirillum brasilense]|uniref:formylglycine-generating enzyme family protein n=1 Tax=Azospirillum brasilense TaxID=192 RepID=UPI0019660DDA|nr:formylglycine-generating enzyme family protein [Azospirillum brasilense]